MRKLNVAVIIAMAFALVAPSMAIADKKKAANTQHGLYMKPAAVSGDVTTQGHSNWIELRSAPKPGTSGASAVKSGGARSR